ncbi:class I lanthipeptide [Pedobacter sp. MR2016-19]|uniref:class I lanthipeptide n=1 Tax=Pedobacter sp. MR2016-19 TaxID=2780089 RepID=UPI0018745933|nr:class I lanthipeptide [Pedobacter sp. MR2016-19]MBE5317700.1 class I lanthipeptide [Pedobacter sp. MR2016-19]
MKKVKLLNKAQLEKEIISELSEDQLKEVQGGNAIEFSCWADSCKGPVKEDQDTLGD